VATISPATVTASVTAASKPYDGTTIATLTSCTLTGVIAGDVAGCTGIAAFDTPEAGANKTVTVAGLMLTGGAAANHALASPTATTTAAIGIVTVTPAVTVASRSYDATVTAMLTKCTVGPPTPAGLVAAYSFDEGSGATVTDTSGHGLNGTLINAARTS